MIESPVAGYDLIGDGGLQVDNGNIRRPEAGPQFTETVVAIEEAPHTPFEMNVSAEGDRQPSVPAGAVVTAAAEVVTDGPAAACVLVQLGRGDSALPAIGASGSVCWARTASCTAYRSGCLRSRGTLHSAIVEDVGPRRENPTPTPRFGNVRCPEPPPRPLNCC